MARQTGRTAERGLQSPRVILCEGTDEVNIFELLRKRRSLGERDVELRDAGGRDQLLTVLGDLRSESGGSALRLVAVVLDAEERSSADLLLLTRLQEAATEHGLALRLFVLPDEQNAGALETLARRHTPAGEAPAICASGWEGCIAPALSARTQAQKDKAWLQVWLAGSGVYNKARLGVALKQVSEVEQQLDGLLQHFSDILDQVLAEPLS